MKESTFLFEVSQERITPITVTATSESEAKEKLLLGEGDAGDYYFGDVRIVKVRVLGHG